MNIAYQALPWAFCALTVYFAYLGQSHVMWGCVFLTISLSLLNITDREL
jgi:hypothetical protein